MKRLGILVWNIIILIARTILDFMYRLFNKELTDEAFKSWEQFIKFGMVGALNTVLNYIITETGYFFLRSPLRDETLALQISQTAAFVITVFISFLINNTMVFTKKEGETRNPWLTLLKTYVAYSVTGIFLNNLLVYIEMNIIHVSALIAPIINLIVDVPINFFLNKLWAYKTK